MLKSYRSSYKLFLIWLLSISISMLTGYAAAAAFTIFYTGILPFLWVVFWISNSETGKILREYAKKWHIGLFISWLAFAYTIYAQKWAAETINQVFFVDAENFGVTYKLLAFFFTPFGIFYQESILSGIWMVFSIFGLILSGLLPVLLIIPTPFKIVIRIFGMSFLTVFLFSFFIVITSTLALNKESLIKSFALWADFNSNNLCTDDWAKKTESVIFLGGEYVLAYQPEGPNGKQFSVETCNYEKKL